MRLRLAAAAFAVLFACAAPASAATIYTFSLSDNTGPDPGSILSFSFDPQGAGGILTVTKELDSFTPIVFLAVASGTPYAGATFSAFDGVVSPATRLFEYSLTDVLFTSVQLGGALEPLETFTILGQTVTLTRGPASVPEPATVFLLATAVALALRRRWSVSARLLRLKTVAVDSGRRGFRA